MSRRVLVAFDVSDAQAADLADLVLSVQARLCDEAGYLGPHGEDGPVIPLGGTVHVAVVNDDAHLDAGLLESGYYVAFER